MENLWFLSISETFPSSIPKLLYLPILLQRTFTRKTSAAYVGTLWFGFSSNFWRKNHKESSREIQLTETAYLYGGIVKSFKALMRIFTGNTSGKDGIDRFLESTRGFHEIETVDFT